MKGIAQVCRVGERIVAANRYKFLFGGVMRCSKIDHNDSYTAQNIPKAAELYTRQINCMAYESYLNKAVTKIK